jgi:polyphosphate kinase 2 (PPK2 family)
MFSDTCCIFLPGGGRDLRPQLVQSRRVERVMGFCTEDQAKAFPKHSPFARKDHGRLRNCTSQVLFEVTPEEQTNRLTARIDGKRKIWKLSQMDLASYTRWDDYTRARDDMFQATDTAWAPWFIARSDNKM